MDGGSKFLVKREARPFGKDGKEHSNEWVFHAGVGKTSKPQPSTSRALVLRKATYGTGELVFHQKLSGQEKLSLLAKEMMTSAVRAPFRLDELLKLADSQLGVHLAEISNLKDKDCFCDDILAMIDSRIESAPDRNGVCRPPIMDLGWVASVVACRVHNVYLLAGAWRIVRKVLKDLQATGLSDIDVRTQLRMSKKLRSRYLVLFDIITMLARMGQQRVANVAAATAHYAPYFVRRNSVGNDVEMEFDHYGKNPRKIREAHKSFIDAILLELVLPGSEYPPYVLVALLHDAVEECRKEGKRFSQALWDSVGDFSVTVEVLDIVEGPLLGTEGESWIRDASVSKEFTEFLRVQALSIKACQEVNSWKSCLEPLIGTQDAESWKTSLKQLGETTTEQLLSQMWYGINQSYQQVSGVGIDDLWALHNDLERLPQWSTYSISGLDVDDSDPDERNLTLYVAKHDKKNLKSEDVTDDEIPPLVTSSDSEHYTPLSDFSDDGELSEGDSESDYASADDELLQDMLQKALENAIETDLSEPPDDHPASVEAKSNPFTRMFDNLKGRYFLANPVLRANDRGHHPFKAGEGDTSSIPRMSQTSKAAQPAKSDCSTYTSLISELDSSRPDAVGASSSQRAQRSADKAVEDEDSAIQPVKKKKKKKKKKTSKNRQETAVSSQFRPVQQFISALPNPLTPAQTATGSLAKQTSHQSTIQSSVSDVDPNVSPSLPFAQEATAQSARAYIRSGSLTTEKTKVKTRPAFAGGFFKLDKEAKKPKESESEMRSFLDRMKRISLPKRIGDLMIRLISSADGKTHAKKPMKWEEFLKVMRAMGFSYDPSTAGSSVRFDPPDPKDPSITFHKPHPDPTLQRNHLRDFGKRLKKTYGWNPEQFDGFDVQNSMKTNEPNF